MQQLRIAKFDYSPNAAAALWSVDGTCERSRNLLLTYQCFAAGKLNASLH
jgi:hypothetical protein